MIKVRTFARKLGGKKTFYVFLKTQIPVETKFGGLMEGIVFNRGRHPLEFSIQSYLKIQFRVNNNVLGRFDRVAQIHKTEQRCYCHG